MHQKSDDELTQPNIAVRFQYESSTGNRNSECMRFGTTFIGLYVLARDIGEGIALKVIDLKLISEVFLLHNLGMLY
jgi:hypothetical protein